MRYLDLTLPTPAENLALDEALLDEAESVEASRETLRFWEPTRPMVVVGRSSHLEKEVFTEVCRIDEVPILRRTSGGASIVTGPGCLMYALVLSYEKRPELRALEAAHRFVLKKITSAIEPWCPGIHCAGTSDLAIGNEKFSGNSVRCRRRHFLYHGTLLFDFPLGQITKYLKTPPRMPEYRRQRPHTEFVTNLKMASATLRQAIADVWDARESSLSWPQDRTAELARERYTQTAWNECL